MWPFRRNKEKPGNQEDDWQEVMNHIGHGDAKINWVFYYTIPIEKVTAFFKSIFTKKEKKK
jgi:hypothetical protein